MSDHENLTLVPHNSPVVPKYTYALLQETSGEECESWYYFIRYQGNEEALAYLEKQLDSIEWYTLDDLSTFVIETQYLVSESTAKEMTKVDINHVSFHRKFDGKLKMIDLGLKNSYSNEKKMTKVFDKISYGQIEDYIDQEDIDSEDLATHSEDNSDEDRESNESNSDSESSEENKEDKEDKKENKKRGKLPGVLSSNKKIEIPRKAMAKQHRKK
jgi:hypothetical protein